MSVLYLGLSNNIRGIAEYLAGAGHLSGFVKPGDARSRVVAAQQYIARSAVDVIVMAEAAEMDALPQFPFVVRELRQEYVQQPILCFTDKMTEQLHHDFLKAGGDILLPFFRKNKGYFTVGGEPLAAQIASLSKRHGKDGWGTILDNQGGLPLVLDYAKRRLIIASRYIELSPRGWKIIQILIGAKNGVMTSEALWKNFEPNGEEQTDHYFIRNSVFKTNQSVRRSFADAEIPKKLQLIEYVKKQGWRISSDTIAYLVMAAQKPLDDASLRVVPSVLLSEEKAKEFAGISIEAGARLALFHGYRLDLTPAKIRILSILTQARGEILSRDELFARCYSPDSMVKKESFGSCIRELAGTIRSQIPRIAENENIAGPRPFIETVGKQGYRITL